MGFKDQWTIYKRHPATRFVDIQSSIRNPNKRRTPYFHSAGLSVESDNVGIFGMTNVRLAYAYHFPVANGYTVGAGTFIGYRDTRYDPTLAIVENPEDPVFERETYSMEKFGTINPGIWINNEKNFLGLSFFQMLKGDMEAVGIDGNNQFSRYFIGDVGMTHDLKNELTVLTSLHALKTAGIPLYLQWNATFGFKDVIFLGVGNRTDAYIGLFRLKFLKVFEVAYSYDYPKNEGFIQKKAEVHEVLLSVKPCWPKKKKLTCPSY